ncbi:putative G-protein coupled receptor [Epithele typhae]|uniref:putative G-protein coupled receptor n=1 Tax=Epithele typhae TaxID=378194 RepID=UPI002007D783|nr:putative G-protein coupled receptor [Epithele typhae]KAH9942412.1 putative G-protein coupled receptor [Epithele typhae]
MPLQCEVREEGEEGGRMMLTRFEQGAPIRPPQPQVRPRRRLSSGRYALSQPCHQLPHSVEALDLSLASLAPTLASLRLHVLSYLADLENRLALLEAPITAESLVAKGETTIEDARAWARDGLDMLRSIREDVCAHIPELTLEGVEDMVAAHIPEGPSFAEMRAHLPDVPDVVRSHLPDFTLSDVRSRLDDVRSRFSDIDFQRPLSFVPTLSSRLQSLQAHLSATEFSSSTLAPAPFPPSATLSSLLDKVLSSDLLAEISSDIRSGEETLEKAAIEVARAMKRSLDGLRLIEYVDLPEQWRNNQFVQGANPFYLQVHPAPQWPRIVLSLFALHNETLNIHTHLIPFLLWSRLHEPAQVVFGAFALLCLFTSSLWHTMAGCAHPQGMELCARVDYVGIGWLISASVGTVVYYGFQCQHTLRDAFLLLCLAIGVSGSIFPFCDWFNQREYKNWRIAFFLSLAFSSLAPIITLAYLHSPRGAASFIAPIAPSFLSYIIGLVFYATHFPECVLAHRWPALRANVLDWLGGGSHAIWHVCIVAAIALHRRGMVGMRGGIGDGCAWRSGWEP